MSVNRVGDVSVYGIIISFRRTINRLTATWTMNGVGRRDMGMF